MEWRGFLSPKPSGKRARQPVPGRFITAGAHHKSARSDITKRSATGPGLGNRSLAGAAGIDDTLSFVATDLVTTGISKRRSNNHQEQENHKLFHRSSFLEGSKKSAAPAADEPKMPIACHVFSNRCSAPQWPGFIQPARSSRHLAPPCDNFVVGPKAPLHGCRHPRHPLPGTGAVTRPPSSAQQSAVAHAIDYKLGSQGREQNAEHAADNM